MEMLAKNTKETDMKLLQQYRKELANLINGRGLAEIMSSAEIKLAIKDLEEAIECYRGYLY